MMGERVLFIDNKSWASICNSSSHTTLAIHHAHSRTSNVEASGTLQRRRTYTIVQHITDAWHSVGSELSQSWAPWLEIWGKRLPTLNLPPTLRGSAGRGRRRVAAVSSGAPPPRKSPPRGSVRDRIYIHIKRVRGNDVKLIQPVSFNFQILQGRNRSLSPPEEFCWIWESHQCLVCLPGK